MGVDMDGGLLALAGLGIALGLRHGIDWDHIAAITDITSSAVATDEAQLSNTSAAPGTNLRFAADGPALAFGSASAPLARAVSPAEAARVQRRQEVRRGLFLATMYALGHATLVVLLGLLAIWTSAVLPDWIDPLMERLVGVTLLLLGAWIIYSLVRHGRDFRLQSRWMVVFALARRGWDRLRAAATSAPIPHRHDTANYGPGTAFGVGLIHGIGAETGSQAVLLASAAGATTRGTGTILLLFFTIGLLISNSLVAGLSSAGFVTAGAKRTLYVIVGVLAAVFSLVVGVLFLTGRGTVLPDLQELLNGVFGTIPGTE